VRGVLKFFKQPRNPGIRNIAVRLAFRSCFLFCALLSINTNALAEVSIADQDLIYNVSYANKNVGKLEISIRNENNGYRLTSITKPTKLAGLVLKEHTSETIFVWRDNELALQSAVEKLEGKKSYDRGFTFDFENNVIQLNEGKTSEFKEGDQFESVTFPLLLMHRDVNSVEDMSVSEVSPKRLRSYTYDKPIQETIEVPAGEFESMKITRFRSDRPEDTVIVWLNQSDNPIPLKIAISKGGKASTMVLSEF